MEIIEYEAVYEDGVFKPIGNVVLPNQTKVVVRQAEPQQSGDRESLKKQMFESLSRSYETGQTDMAAKHNEHQS